MVSFARRSDGRVGEGSERVGTGRGIGINSLFLGNYDKNVVKLRGEGMFLLLGRSSRVYGLKSRFFYFRLFRFREVRLIFFSFYSGYGAWRFCIFFVRFLRFF